MNNEYLNKIICADTLKFLPELAENSIDIVITDPPYFLDKMDNNWDYEKVSNKKNLQTVQSLPAGMKFDKEQGKRFYDWYSKVSEQLFRILKPGGFFFSFSSPRLYHRMACAIEDSGFNIRDCFIWLYTQNQPKAMSLDHFIRKMAISEEKQNELIERLNGWKTPQIKSCFEPISVGQKPVDETFLNNIIKNDVGLMNTNVKIGNNMYPANVFTTENILEQIDKAFLISKPTKQEKGNYNNHKTVKPVDICKYLIELTAFNEDAVILDPFMGSGTTAVAAKMLGVNYIGIEHNKEYVEIAEERLLHCDKEQHKINEELSKHKVEKTFKERKSNYSIPIEQCSQSLFV
ncbi:MAG: site-specific DNA-methyltransferase [Ignavibacteria bacterium]|jgi:site-specific DNA-methyltransferase (adenine-specific)|nr:site-specific DNA-methyltransferase [Ignavibacteria bacterium]